MAAGSTPSRPIRNGPYPELTWQAILVGYAIGSLLALSIGYASLKLGFSIEGSELAAILGFGVLRGVMGRRSIVENNINQSLASAVNAASSGMMFSLPALFILGYGDRLNVPMTLLGCVTGGILGIAFVIPLRKQMIDFERLPYPGGIAVATILKSPGAGVRKAWLLLAGAAISGIVQAITQVVGVDTIPLFQWIGLPEYLNGIWLISLMTVGVGYLSGRGGVYFVVGGFVCYWFIAPILNLQGLVPPAEAGGSYGAVANQLRVALFRPVGIGMLIGGAITGVALALPLVVSAIRSMQDASKTKSEISKDELPISLLYKAVAGAFVLMLVMAELSVPEMTFLTGATMAVLGTLWIWMAGVILSECIGRTNWSPLSGMTLIGITILIFISRGISGGDPAPTIVASVMVGAAMCVAMSQATDLMLDLKTGYLVGAITRKQQIAQLARHLARPDPGDGADLPVAQRRAPRRRQVPGASGGGARQRDRRDRRRRRADGQVHRRGRSRCGPQRQRNRRARNPGRARLLPSVQHRAGLQRRHGAALHLRRPDG